jgi:PAS domain S-box-containing protein
MGMGNFHLRMQHKWMLPVIVAAMVVILVTSIYHHQMMDRVAETRKDDATQVASQPEPSESLGENYSFYTWMFGLLGVILIGGTAWYAARPSARRIKQLHSTLETMAQGKTSSSLKLKAQGTDEMANMARSINKIIDDDTEKIRFSAEIREGNLGAQLDKAQEDDLLARSLIGVQEKLQQAKKEAEEREKEEQKRRWTNEGIAQFADLLRRNHDKLEDLGYSIISNLVQYLDANQGGIFLLNDNDPENTFFELQAAYAFDRKKHLEKQIQWGEGLVGNVALERKHVYMTELPQDYINITSGLGGANPDSLLIMPLQTDEEVVGVLEIASFKKMEQYQIDFVQKVAESIASTITSMKTNIKTNELLEKSQQQAEEMKSQEEEMRQNMEEMQSTQEELSRKIEDNEKMHQELAREKALLDALMNNLPDYIYFKDRNSQFIRISKSMLPLFPVEDVEEMIGKSDFDFHRKEAAQGMYDEEQEIIRTENGFEDKIQHEITETGKDQWVSVTKLPLYDQDGKLMGTFGISKDITRFKQLETEARKKTNDD